MMVTRVVPSARPRRGWRHGDQCTSAPVVVVDLLPREPGALPPGRRGTGGRNPEESRYRTRHRDPAKPDGWRRRSTTGRSQSCRLMPGRRSRDALAKLDSLISSVAV